MNRHARRSCRSPIAFQARSVPGSSASQKPAAPFQPVCRSRGCRHSSSYRQGQHLRPFPRYPRPFFFAHAETEHSISNERINVCSILRTLGRIVLHQLLEHLFPTGQLYIQKSVCVIQIASIHTKEGFDTLVKLWFVMVEEE